MTLVLAEVGRSTRSAAERKYTSKMEAMVLVELEQFKLEADALKEVIKELRGSL